MTTRIGVEVGGTFTDLVMFHEGAIEIAKVPSTPDKPDRGAINAITASGADLSTVADLVHGSTVATNAVLERKGAKICLVVTAGTRDILFLQRHNRKQIYDLFYQKPEPVLRRRDIIEVGERMAPDGAIIDELNLDAAKDAIANLLKNEQYGAMAICFLNSYANPEHEIALADYVRRTYPALSVTASHEICREFREYERCSTTTLAAYVQPVIDAYLNRFSAYLKTQGYGGRFSVMQSNGGRLPAQAMGRNAITALFSGPAAGVMGAIRQAARSGCENIITFDMGGTSTDVSLVENGQPTLSSNTEIDGLPVKTPVIDIATVGAGGGSIAWIDNGGLLRVGPQSAGAEPGPVCYGRGGHEVTITDAHLLRGTIRAESFLGGRMEIDKDASRAAMAGFAEKLGLPVEQTADSIIQVGESNIVGAIQRVSTERGKDPRDYVLVPFGGAGPMQAVRVAEQLGINTVLVPPFAGVLSAYGLLASDFLHYESRTQPTVVNPESMTDLRQVVSELAGSVCAYLRELGLDDDIRLQYFLDMRYVGQAFEIAVEVTADELPSLTADALRQRFDGLHHQIFEFGKAAENDCEIISFRVGGSVSPGEVPQLREQGETKGAGGEVEIFEQGVAKSCRIYARAGLSVGPNAGITGPALIEDMTSTIFLPDGWRAERDAQDNLIITRDGENS